MLENILKYLPLNWLGSEAPLKQNRSTDTLTPRASLPKEASTLLSDKLLAWLMSVAKLHYIPRFENPRSLNEKINYIKLYNRNTLRSVVADRVLVRDYVEKIAPECSLIPQPWYGNELTLDIWQNLPDQFAIKASHGSQMTRLIDKSKNQFEQVRDDVQRWVNTDYSRLGREWMYKQVEHRVVVEELILLANGKIPSDFKFFAANGEVHMVQIDSDRFSAQTRNLYTPDFKPMEGRLAHPNGPCIEKPALYEKAKHIAEKLSQDFDFMRVDLYIMDDDVYFGEMTNTPGNGFRKFTPNSLDFWLGDKLPDKPDR